MVYTPDRQGRVDAYALHRQSSGWLAVVAKLRAKRRGQRCACCGGRRRLDTHHWHYPPRRAERTIWLVRLCRYCHLERVHRLSFALFGKRTRGLWFTTLVVVLWGKAGQRFGWGQVLAMELRNAGQRGTRTG
jgi:hypothetical protein